MEKKRKHKKTPVQNLNFYFMDVKTQDDITTAFSFAQMVVLCVSFTTVFWQPTENCSFRRKHTKSTLNQEWEPLH